MMNSKGYRSVALSYNRHAVITILKISSTHDPMHCITEVDVTEPMGLMKEHYEKTGVKLSLTAYVVACLARILTEFPAFNSFIRGRKLILLDDITVVVYIEREIRGEPVPEPVAIKNAHLKTYSEIHAEIRKAQMQNDDSLGSLSDAQWIRFVPRFLGPLIARILDNNIRFARKYGKAVVSSVGMYYRGPSWYVPNGTTTVQVVIGGMNRKVVEHDGVFSSADHLCLTVTFDHRIVDGGPAARFMQRLTDLIRSGDLLRD